MMKIEKDRYAHASYVTNYLSDLYDSWSLFLINGSLYAIGASGKVYRYDESSSWEEAASSAPDDWSTSSYRHRYCVHNDVVYVVQQFNNHMWSWDESNGWRKLVDDNAGYNQAIDVAYWNGHILCLSQNGYILKYEI
jgi:hypothetical protein